MSSQARGDRQRRPAQHRHDACGSGPMPKFFDSDKFSVPQLKHVLKAKAVLCPGLRVTFRNEATRREGRVVLHRRPRRLPDRGTRRSTSAFPPSRSPATRAGDDDAVDCALCWAPDAELTIGESYVNLIPTTEGGTHVNGLRAGRRRRRCASSASSATWCRAASSSRPRTCGTRRSYVLSVKMREPQFAGQTKERLGLARCRRAGRGLRRATAMALWLNQPPGRRRAHRAVRDRQRTGARQGRAARGAQAHRRRPGAARQARRLRQPGPDALASCSWSRATRPAAPPSRRATRTSRPSCRCAARS